MKDNDCVCLKKEIDLLRKELHELIESEKLSSSIVQQRSKELDELILLYVRLKGQDLNDP
ncbi:MAG: aspartyl-phosphate phosphatase Spo0E family protein [Acetivibrionales bacterium]|nr:aspartyl-phosphate phosphatase Spo0E family protein [Bacillota bacterium]NLP07893.1 aspartyl-phosphate phosphatase Spo0E family protein [Clostridiaceae bacterium]HOA54419.1 aspartyl-phosphate phosphatase Spo0E family protein [Clostridiales bacterium]HPZ05392.1 aspartyl-phosphate phosphatase Spo0E family protein [Clostridiales bacterium]HQD30398.1 aspartyl-phosphate phosphatase Spo0E family protein [Clostridiales bacterium]